MFGFYSFALDVVAETHTHLVCELSARQNTHYHQIQFMSLCLFQNVARIVVYFDPSLPDCIEYANAL